MLLPLNLPLMTFLHEAKASVLRQQRKTMYAPFVRTMTRPFVCFFSIRSVLNNCADSAPTWGLKEVKISGVVRNVG